MKNKWTYLAFIAVAALSSWITYKCTKTKVDRTPIWHPFELNSNIDLKSLVKEGYRCMGRPCGQAQFVKINGDTSIQYDINGIDCNSYSGHFDPDELEYELEEKELIPITNYKQDSAITENEEPLSDSARDEKKISMWKEFYSENPYYPYDSNKIDDCYQNISFRVYRIYMKSIDSNKIVQFINENDGIIGTFQDWNTRDGGKFLVFHSPSSLFFICTITKSELFNWKEDRNWEFKIERFIPYLDQQAKLRAIEHWKKKRAYYRPTTFDVYDI